MNLFDRLEAERAAKDRRRGPHNWRSTPAAGPGSGGYECQVCGWWMSALRNPNLYIEGCPGGPEPWRLLLAHDRVTAPDGTVYVLDRFIGDEYAVCVDAQDVEHHLRPETLTRKR